MNNLIEALTEKVGTHLTNYKDDLVVHDRNLISKNPNIPFLHWTRTHGTTISFLFPKDSSEFPKPGETVPYLFGRVDREALAKKPAEVATCFLGRAGIKTLYFNGTELKEISPEQALDTAKDYARQVTAGWSTQLR